MSETLLKIRNLTVKVDETNAEIVNDVHLTVPELSITALVGGSGSGKTTTGMSILRLLGVGLQVSSGEILYAGRNLLTCTESEIRKIRGGQISMVFQEPLNAFNPVFSIGYQIDEMLTFHTDLNRKKREERVLELLEMVGLPDPKRVAENFPHQLSGGMRQRAMIAQAIAAQPKLIIADEPTSNLDVTLQARIMELFQKLKDELDLSILLITHDLGMVGHMADQVAVMSKGKIVETGTTKDVIEKPKHDYTKKLMQALQI